MSTILTLEACRLYTLTLTLITTVPITCYNYYQPGYIAKDYTKPRHVDLKDIKEDKDKDLGKEYA